MRNLNHHLSALLALCILSSNLPAVQAAEPGSTTVIYEDTNAPAGGDFATTHQERPDYWIEKTLQVSPQALTTARYAKLRVKMCLQDYSYSQNPAAPNGLDESFELVVNGHSHVFRTDAGFPARASSTATMVWKWHEFSLPVDEIKAGPNTFLFRKLPSPGAKNDDYLYIGIDNAVTLGHSRSTLDGGKTWRSDKLNAVDANGEYMMRLILASNDGDQVSARWTPARLEDSTGFIGYASSKGHQTDLEIDAAKIDRSKPWRATVNYEGAKPPMVQWFDAHQKLVPAEQLPPTQASAGQIEFTWPADADKSVPVARLQAVGSEASRLTSVQFSYNLDIDSLGSEKHGMDSIDLAPLVAKPSGKPAVRSAQVRRIGSGFVLENKFLSASFSLKPQLKLDSLYHEYLKKNVLAHPELTHLFLIEVDGKRFGAEDFTVKSATPLAAPRKGLLVTLALPQHNLEAKLRLEIDESDLRFGLDVKNVGDKAASWKTAFPQIGGLQLSDEEKSDYYLLPSYGGLIADKPVAFRSIYGAYTAWWQMVDLFSPTGGSGLSIRSDDTKGGYKLINFRKGSTPGFVSTAVGANVQADLLWKDSLQTGPGSALAIEYLSRTRAPGQGFEIPDAVIDAHPGDWHVSMQRYADWAHRVWKWQPLPEKLKNTWSIYTPGWGTDSLFANGKFRTDYFKNADASELMSWWEWSKKAPWGVAPNDVPQIREKLGSPFYDEYLKGYLGTDGATQDIQYSFNTGDYAYHKSWGGLPALKTHIRNMAAHNVMSMLYTCPPLADANTELGRKYGEQYGIKYSTSSYPYKLPVSPPGYIGDFGSWNMCIDTAWYQDHVAKMLGRIIADTGADGFRTDVFGYPGYACTNEKHQHVNAEPGHNAYIQATMQAMGKIRAAVDKVRPGVIISAEYPGYDAMSRYLNATIAYECSWNLMPGIRMVPSNVYRFYFPELKMFDLDDLDPKRRAAASYEFTFWNGMGRFGTMQHPQYNRILRENGDAFSSMKPQALIPTLQRNVYANRFSLTNKSLTTIFNSRRFTVEAPLVEVNLKPTEHLFELVRGTEVPVATNGGKKTASLKLGPNQAACLARLERRLTVAKTATGWNLTVLATADKKAKPGALRLVLCSAEGITLSEATVNSGKASIRRPTEAQLTALTETEKKVVVPQAANLPAISALQPAYFKLMQGNFLVDAIALP